MKRGFGKMVGLVLTSLCLYGCAQVIASIPGVPESIKPAADIAEKAGVKALEASREISDSEEYYLGRAVAARILSRYPLYKNQVLTAYVNEVGQTVARKSIRPQTYKGYHFAVLDSQEANSFACPGGIIFITRGMIKACANEDQLAAVLAHEVGHIANRDGIASISQARWTEVATTIGTEAAKQYGGSLGQMVSLFEGSIDDVFKTVIVNGYSRTAEENADREGVETLKRAGYNPQAMVAILTAMSTKGGTGGILGTHPDVKDRLANIKFIAQAAHTRMEPARSKRFKALKL
ncbi:M48 family metalloprotease [Desulfobacca acetoxidans]|uniref:Peptidase M48 Ste24p n=1 Tax=Desulfobacca acetoxidans (strain ATCC 700848 / DSM 11109 / ASRB2) TaxID=880072 RepID=F2NEC4_DESAR|nr:M48 family metalloprotease [Desulfobacca acetoxidans]AEB08114.1 peptidase M48 Ste24p [Desulfobacca acetoxidans DSM 11109]